MLVSQLPPAQSKLYWPQSLKKLALRLCESRRTLLDAGAGTGKTALCAESFQGLPITYQAFASNAPNGEWLAHGLATHLDCSPAQLLAAELLELHQRVSKWSSSQKRVLLLDHVHLLNDALGLGLLNHLLQLAIENFTLVLCSRAYPSALDLAPLLKSNQLELISQDQLLWKTEDLDKWPVTHVLSPEKRQQLWTLSGGVIGIMQAAMISGAKGIVSPWLMPVYRQHMQQTMAELPAELRQQLPALAVLNSLEASELALLGSESPERIWSGLYQWHLAVCEQNSWRLLPAWRDYLRFELKQSAELKVWQKKLADLSLDAGRHEAALNYALASESREQLMHILARWSPDALTVDIAYRLWDWLTAQADSETLLMQSPCLYVFILWALTLVKDLQADTHFNRLLKLHGDVREQDDDTYQAIDFKRWMSYFHARLASVSEDSQSSLLAFEQALAFSQDRQSHFHAELLIALAGEYFYQARWQDCLTCLEEVLQFYLPLGEGENSLSARVKIARTHMMMGRFSEASHSYEQALKVPQAQEQAMIGIFALSDRALIALLELGSADVWLDRLPAYDSLTALNLQWLYLVRCLDLELLRRNWGQAAVLLERLQELTGPMPEKFKRDYQTRRIWLLLETWQLDSAGRLLAELGDLANRIEGLEDLHQNFVWYGVLTRYLLRRQRYSEAFELNYRLLEAATQSETRLYQRVFELIQEVIRYRMGHQKEQALNQFMLLLEALLRAQQGGLVLYAGPEALPLLHELRPLFAQKDRAAQLQELIDLFPEVHSASQTIELTPREQVLLQLLAQHLSYKEMASHAGVTVNTAKTQLRGLYKKLGANSRNEVLLKAQEAWLL